MRIRKIRLHNLNSLRTEAEIDFDQAPLSLSGLFAITGDTGAGKTTILDALTLALYGRIPRNAAEGEVMSYGTGKSLAEVEFEVKGQVYRSKWSIWRAHEKADGKLQDSRRELSRWDEKKKAFEIIGERKREIDELVAELSGLDYDRFCRSVLLSQGEFAAFLKAKPAERSDLLERITGTGLYSELSKAAFERHKLEKEQLTRLEQELGLLELLPEEQATALKEEQQSLKAKSDQQQQMVSRLREQSAWLQQIDKLEKRLAAQEEDLQQARAAESAFAPEQERLAQHRRALPMQLPLQRLQDKQEQLEELQRAIGAQENELPQLQTAAEQAATAAGEASETHQKLRAELREKAPVIEQVKELDLQIAHQQSALQQQQHQLDESRQQQGEAQQRIEQLGAEIKQLRQSERACANWLDEHKTYAALADDLPDIRAQREQLRERYLERKRVQDKQEENTQVLSQLEKRVQSEADKQEKLQQKSARLQEQLGSLAPDGYAQQPAELEGLVFREIEQLSQRQNKLEKLISLNQEYEQLLRSHDELQDRLQQLVIEHDAMGTEVLNQQDLLRQLDAERARRQDIYEQQLAIANYEKDRARLKEGEPCPLCFSEEHPFRTMQWKPYVDETKKELEQVQSRYEEEFRRQGELLQEQRAVELQIKQLQGDDKDVSGQLQEQTRRMLGFEEQIANLHPEEGSWIKSAHLAREVQAVQQQLEQRQQDRLKLSKLVRELSSLQQALQTAGQQLQESRTRLEMRREEAKQLEQETKEQADKFEAQARRIGSLFEKYGFTFSEETARESFQALEKRKADWEQHQSEAERLGKLLAIKQSALEEQRKQLKERELSAEKLSKAVEVEATKLKQQQSRRQELFGAEDPKQVQAQLEEGLQNAEAAEKEASSRQLQASQALVQLNASLKDKRAAAEQAAKQAGELKAAAQEQSAALGFEEVAAAAAALLEDTEAAALEAKAEDIRQRAKDAQQAYSATQEELQTERARALTREDAAALQMQLEAENQQLAKLQQEYGALSEQLRQQAQRRERAAGLAEQIDAQSRQYQRWAQLNDIIGQADGKKFRAFAQGLTLQKLVQLANFHLQQLHGRYLIQKREGEELELDIVDTYQADNRRSMNTLSGGESFLVSLALALGLSDLAGRHTQIQSLFIDEGFGTLDENTLDLAIATLENLQASGKTIGIISHVKALKERIATQIRVEKQGNGFSRVRVVG